MTDPASIDPAERERPTWRCFHCDLTFTDKFEAEIHFGRSEHFQPMCLVDAINYREMEERMRRYNDEDADLHRQIHRMESDHQQALMREEEKGYARGLKDACASCENNPANYPAEPPSAWLMEPNEKAHQKLKPDVTLHRPPDRGDWTITPLVRAALSSTPQGALAELVGAWDARHAFMERDNSDMSDYDYQQASEAVEHAFDSAMNLARAALATQGAQGAADIFERGRQQGMKQERALWELAAEGQRIEAGESPAVAAPQKPLAELMRLFDGACDAAVKGGDGAEEFVIRERFAARLRAALASQGAPTEQPTDTQDSVEKT